MILQFEEASLGIFAYDKNVIPYLNSNLKFDTGIYVAQISLDSPAFISGLEVRDVVRVSLIRNNRERSVDIMLVRK